MAPEVICRSFERPSLRRCQAARGARAWRRRRAPSPSRGRGRRRGRPRRARSPAAPRRARGRASRRARLVLAALVHAGVQIPQRTGVKPAAVRAMPSNGSAAAQRALRPRADGGGHEEATYPESRRDRRDHRPLRRRGRRLRLVLVDQQHQQLGGAASASSSTAAPGGTAGGGARGGGFDATTLKTLATKLGVSTSALQRAMQSARPTGTPGQQPSGSSAAVRATWRRRSPGR